MTHALFLPQLAITISDLLTKCIPKDTRILHVDGSINSKKPKKKNGGMSSGSEMSVKFHLAKHMLPCYNVLPVDALQ